MPDIEKHPIRYWLWLSLAIPAGSALVDVILPRFGNDPCRIYNADYNELKQIKELDHSPAIRNALWDKSMERVDEILTYCAARKIFLLAPGHPGYPERLMRISRMPLVLYCKGGLPDIDKEPCLAVVGTRSMTSYGKRMAYQISYDLACAGAIVVSGMALGIDTVAHRACLDAGGFTIAVMGCGLDITYPRENFELMEEIEKKGLVISEYPPGTRPIGSNFPTRNRIISGLSLGCTVIEASASSGALITARHAKKQGRDVYAVPGSVGEQNSEGTNELIQEGAIAVTEARDITAEYELLYPSKLNSANIRAFRPRFKLFGPRTAKKSSPDAVKVESAPSTKEETEPITRITETLPIEKPIEIKIPEKLAKNHADVYRAIAQLGTPTQDEIIQKNGLSASEAMVILTVLEVHGYIRSLPGGRYTILK